MQSISCSYERSYRTRCPFLKGCEEKQTMILMVDRVNDWHIMMMTPHNNKKCFLQDPPGSIHQLAIRNVEDRDRSNNPSFKY